MNRMEVKGFMKKILSPFWVSYPRTAYGRRSRTYRRLILRSIASAMRLEGWGGPMLRDALLRSAPQHEAEKALR
jgi:hypothetical protein